MGKLGLTRVLVRRQHPSSRIPSKSRVFLNFSSVRNEISSQGVKKHILMTSWLVSTFLGGHYALTDKLPHFALLDSTEVSGTTKACSFDMCVGWMFLTFQNKECSSDLVLIFLILWILSRYIIPPHLCSNLKEHSNKLKFGRDVHYDVINHWKKSEDFRGRLFFSGYVTSYPNFSKIK